MTSRLFDPAPVAHRRARAEAMGGDYFLHERAFDECLDRLAAVRRSFRSVLLFGIARPDWTDRLRAMGCSEIVVVEPGSDAPLPNAPDLCLSIGALDTVNELPGTLAALNGLIAPGGLLMGALAGGDSLPTLRAAMQAADRATGHPAAPHVHPRIDAASFAALLTSEGFTDPVVDIDRVRLRYPSLDALVRDLRGMAVTNRLLARPRRPVLRIAREAARASFMAGASDGRASETVDILHFAAWTAALPTGARTPPA